MWNQNIGTVKYNHSPGTSCKIEPLFYRQERWFITSAAQGLGDDSEWPWGMQSLRWKMSTNQRDQAQGPKGEEFASERGQLSPWALERLQAEFCSWLPWNKRYKRRGLCSSSSQWDQPFWTDVFCYFTDLTIAQEHRFQYSRFFHSFFLSTFPLY